MLYRVHKTLLMHRSQTLNNIFYADPNVAQQNVGSKDNDGSCNEKAVLVEQMTANDMYAWLSWVFHEYEDFHTLYSTAITDFSPVVHTPDL